MRFQFPFLVVKQKKYASHSLRLLRGFSPTSSLSIATPRKRFLCVEHLRIPSSCHPKRSFSHQKNVITPKQASCSPTQPTRLAILFFSGRNFCKPPRTSRLILGPPWRFRSVSKLSLPSRGTGQFPSQAEVLRDRSPLLLRPLRPALSWIPPLFATLVNCHSAPRRMQRSCSEILAAVRSV